jgi:hypothetical protein
MRRCAREVSSVADAGSSERGKNNATSSPTQRESCARFLAEERKARMEGSRVRAGVFLPHGRENETSKDGRYQIEFQIGERYRRRSEAYLSMAYDGLKINVPQKRSSL